MKAKIQVITPNGFTVILETPAVEDRRKLLEILPKFEAELLEIGYRPALAVASNGPMLTADVASFPAETLTAMVNDGKAYWKVKGGHYQKFGVTIWPEILEASGFDPEDLNPIEPVDLSGWIAHYVVNDEGKPKKIIKLEKIN